MTNRMAITAWGVSNLNIPAYCIPRADEGSRDATVRSIMRANNAARHTIQEAGRAADWSYRDHNITLLSATGSVIGRCTIRVR